MEVRIERLVAGSGGRLVATGQVALSSPVGTARERLERFSLSVPLEGATPAAVGVALGALLDALAGRIVAWL